LLLGWEQVRIAPGETRFTRMDLYDFPWSHGFLKRESAIKWGATVVWIGVVRVAFDWMSHRPDMPLYPGGHGRYGLAE
jgi:hypothetical protein